MKLFRDVNRRERENEEAVSPVVGVMLMLVVTIIIAAVVSGFSGGLIGGNNQKTPTLAMDVKITNTGTAATSGFSATVLSISQPTTTDRLKLTTSWVTTMKDNSSYTAGSIQRNTPNGKGFAGGNESYKGSKATPIGAPYGFGPGVAQGNVSLTAPYDADQYFGNYTLTQGTGLIAEPPSTYGTDGASLYTYSSSSSSSATQAVLGSGWEQLRSGDVVMVRVILTSTGKELFQKDVVVTGV
jgi:archaeal type IV pilus assembly protein PilA